MQIEKIANNVVLTEENQKYLPPSYETLYLLSRIMKMIFWSIWKSTYFNWNIETVFPIFGFQNQTASEVNSYLKISISIPEKLSREETVQLKIYLSEIKKISGVIINNSFDY